MEQVLPGEDPDDFDSDPIIAASQLNQAGDREAAQRLLADALAADLRCLDAYAHLGNFAFDRPEDAIRYYETGVQIGQLSLPEGSMGCCRGGGSTTGRSCAACTATGCACGGWAGSTRLQPCSSGCCGSTRPTTRASAACSRPPGRKRHGGQTCEIAGRPKPRCTKIP
jgi:hypothetical protein